MSCICLRLLRTCLFLVVPALCLVLAVNGCGGDGDRVVVDFSKTVPAARPGDGPSQNPPLRVAVAAMVSPKETFDLYRQLLAYLGRKSGKDLEFVQRKTYGEIDDNIYVIGDATNVPTSKAGAVAHYEADSIVENLQREIDGQPALPNYDGHAT
jgi:hypothetical protein